MPSSSGTFKAAEDAKVMQIDVEDLAKTIQIGASLTPNRKAGSSTFSVATRTYLFGVQQK
jgi:hypothetical protein